MKGIIVAFGILLVSSMLIQIWANAAPADIVEADPRIQNLSLNGEVIDPRFAAAGMGGGCC